MTSWRASVNGVNVDVEIDAGATLQSVLHHTVGHRDVRYGCGEGVCGACAVLVDGAPIASCLSLAMQVQQCTIVTAAGLNSVRAAESPLAASRFRALRDHFLGDESFQCGYCACGMLVSADHHVQSGGGPSRSEIRTAMSGHLCRCTGYQRIVDAISKAAAGTSPPAGTPRADLVEKISSTARYPTDGRFENALVGRVKWSAYPEARIDRIDVAQARAVEGVEAVLTWQDIPGRNVAPGTLFARDQPLLARDRVRTPGDAVALVAARSRSAAEQALALINVVYRPDASRRLRPAVVASRFAEGAGNIEAAFQAADRVIEATYSVEPTDHSPIELEGGTGWIDGEDICLETPCQTPFTVKRGVARILGINERRVRPVAGRIGGAFGRYLVPSIEGYLALLVHTTRRPVRLVLERPEVIGRRAKRHRLEATYRLAIDNDGTFRGLKAELRADGGPYQAVTPSVISIFAFEVGGAYRFPAFTTTVEAIQSNALLPAPERGFGSQQVNFGIDSLVEKAARTLGIDPHEVRRRNLRAGPVGSTPHPGLARTLDRLAALAGPPPAVPSGWRLGRGRSCIAAKYGYPYGLVDQAVARLSVDGAGKFKVESDLVDAGTGVTAGLVGLAATALGLTTPPAYEFSGAAVADPTGTLLSSGRPPSAVRAITYHELEAMQLFGSRLLILASTRLSPARLHRLLALLARPLNLASGTQAALKARFFPFGVDSFAPRTSGSRGIFMTGRAVLDAADRLAARARSLAAQRFAVTEDQVRVGDAGAWVTANAAQRLSWAELAAAAGGTLAAVGKASLPKGPLLDPATGNQTGGVDFQPAAHACDLAVHPETGEVRILRYVAVHDVGRALNPAAVNGQVLGGVAMGIGQALYEHLPCRGDVVAVDSSGFREYLLPTMLDIPDGIEVELLELGDGLGPNGAKGVGEAAAVAAPCAIANALYDATGRQPSSLPITPDQIVRLVHGQA